MEYVVIVISVLTAVGINAWWDGRQDRARADTIRAALVAEFEQNLEVLERDSLALVEGRAATNALLGAFSPNPTSLSADSVRALVVNSFAVQTGFEPIGGVSATLGPQEASAFLGDSLSVLLAQWKPQLQVFASQGDLLENGVVRIVGVWADIGLPVSNITPPYVGVPPSGFEGDVRAMLTRVEIESLFASRAVELAELSVEYEAAARLSRQIVHAASAR